MEQAYCTAVFWRGGEKIDLNGLKPDAVRCLSVTGERKVNLSFLRDYPNLEELTLMEKCEGVEVLSGLKQLHTLSLWLSAPVSWDNVSLPGLRVLHLRGEKNGDIMPISALPQNSSERFRSICGHRFHGNPYPVSGWIWGQNFSTFGAEKMSWIGAILNILRLQQVISSRFL